MIKKQIIYILILSLLYNFGCSTIEPVSRKSFEEMYDSGNRESIYLLTREYKEYRFERMTYHIKDDTLHGTGTFIHFDEEQPFVGKISLSDVLEIKMGSDNTAVNAGLALGILALAGLAIITVLFLFTLGSISSE